MLTTLTLAATIAGASLIDDAGWRSLDLKDGRELHFLVQLPETGSAERGESQPRLLLALPPGRQDQAMAERSFELYFDEGAKRGFVVVIPRKIDSRMFHEEDTDVLIQLIDHVGGQYKTLGTPALAGISNGGRSAFRLALDHPSRFSSLTVLPGMPPTEEDFDRLDQLASMPLSMFVGGEDRGWLERMQRVQKALPHASLTVIEGEGHTPRSLTGEMVFDSIPAPSGDDPTATKQAVAETLHDFHDAASKADGPRYFDHFAVGAVFLGTDATERWSVEEFKAYANPYFSQGKGWTYVASERNVSVSAGGSTAWFDERLQNEKYGEVRGSGVLVFERNRWRIAQYNLAFPVPNELSSAFMKLLEESKR